MNCAQCQHKILMGEPLDSLQEHLSECAPCAELADGAGALARQLDFVREDEPMDLDALMQATAGRIAADTGPTAALKRLSTPVRVGLVLGAAGLAVALGGLAARPDMPQVDSVGMGLQLVLLLCIAAAGLWSAMRPAHLPELSDKTILGLLAAATLTPFLLALFPALSHGHPASEVHDFAVQGMLCFTWGSFLAAFVAVIWRFVERRSAPEPLRMATAVATAAAAGNAALVLHCPVTDPLHLAASHATIGLIWAGLVFVGALLMGRGT